MFTNSTTMSLTMCSHIIGNSYQQAETMETELGTVKKNGKMKSIDQLHFYHK